MFRIWGKCNFGHTGFLKCSGGVWGGVVILCDNLRTGGGERLKSLFPSPGLRSGQGTAHRAGTQHCPPHSSHGAARSGRQHLRRQFSQECSIAFSGLTEASPDHLHGKRNPKNQTWQKITIAKQTQSKTLQTLKPPNQLRTIPSQHEVILFIKFSITLLEHSQRKICSAGNKWKAHLWRGWNLRLKDWGMQYWSMLTYWICLNVALPFVTLWKMSLYNNS